MRNSPTSASCCATILEQISRADPQSPQAGGARRAYRPAIRNPRPDARHRQRDEATARTGSGPAESVRDAEQGEGDDRNRDDEKADDAHPRHACIAPGPARPGQLLPDTPADCRQAACAQPTRTLHRHNHSGLTHLTPRRPARSAASRRRRPPQPRGASTTRHPPDPEPPRCTAPPSPYPPRSAPWSDGAPKGSRDCHHRISHRPRTAVPRRASRRHDQTARRGLDRSVHRPLPQGSHRRPRRHPAAHARRAPHLPARTRRTAHRDHRQHHRAGEDDRRAGEGDRAGRHQAGARGPLPAVPPEAPHQGDDRARGRAAAAGRPAARRPDQGPAHGRGRLRRRRQGCRRRRSRTRGRPLHPARAVRRGRAADRQGAQVARGRVAGGHQGGQGQGGPIPRPSATATTSATTSR